MEEKFSVFAVLCCFAGLKYKLSETRFATYANSFGSANFTLKFHRNVKCKTYEMPDVHLVFWLRRRVSALRAECRRAR